MESLKSKKISMPSLPKMVGDLKHSVQFLKLFSLGTGLLALLLVATLMATINRDLPVVTIDSCGKSVSQKDLPNAEDQIREGVKYYLSKRYDWGPQDVVKKLKETEHFISPQSLKAFQSSIANVSKFSLDKIVTQKVYSNKIEIDLNKGTALVIGDRITSIQGLKAAGNMRMELIFETGRRTKENPWGLYISKEREE